jgi:hypothetical protein
MAAATTQRAFDQAARAKAPDVQAGVLLEGEIARGISWVVRAKPGTVQQALSLDKSRQTESTAALAAAVCGNGKLALPLALELSKKYPKDTLIQDDDDREGTQFGPYRLLEKIGSGGMGEVYRALDTRWSARSRSSWFLRAIWLSDVGSGLPGLRARTTRPGHGTPHSGSHLSHERFLREARSAATLNHPNVCSIHDTGEQDGRPYLVMELLRGETLKQYLAKSRRQGTAADEVVSFSQQAAAALAAAHAKGIIHRDIKPANLFVSMPCGASGKSRFSTSGWPRSRWAWRRRTRAPTAPGEWQRGRDRSGPGTATMELTSPGLGGGDRGLYVSGAGEGRRRWTRGPTCSAWARSSTRWRRGRRPSPAVRRRKSLPRCCGRIRRR